METLQYPGYLPTGVCGPDLGYLSLPAYVRGLGLDYLFA